MAYRRNPKQEWSGNGYAHNMSPYEQHEHVQLTEIHENPYESGKNNYGGGYGDPYYRDIYHPDPHEHNYEQYSDGSDTPSETPLSINSDSSGNYDHKKLTLMQACGLNTMNMFGTGPFITIPFVVAAADPPGPQALIGYACAAFACMNDSLIWSELGSMWPDSGGSYVYLRELYGRHTYGRLMAFLFVWQIMVSGPMECASGFIATAQYLAFITKTYTYLHHSLIAFFMCLATVWALYREIDEVGTITLVLWAFTIAAILFAIIAGYTAFDPKYIELPDDAFSDGGKFFVSLGVAARFAVYDFTGYYDVNFVGKECQNPRKTIPVANIATCCIVAMVFFAVDVAVIGSLPWSADEESGYVRLVTSGDNSANYIMALFCETHVGSGFAIFFTIIVAITIFGSCFSFMIGLAQIPYTAAKDGYFYHFLSHQHETYDGLSDYALLFVGSLSTIFCFVDLQVVIEGMLTMQLLIQFMAQGFGLMYYRFLVHPDDQEAAGFEVPMFPIPNIIQLLVFGFIFVTTENYIFEGGTPLLEVALLFILIGCVMYFLWAKKNGFWPYSWEELDSDDEGLDHMVVYVADDGFDDEFGALKKRLLQKEEEIRKLQLMTNESSTKIADRDADLNNTIKALGQKEYRIITLTRKLEEQQERHDAILVTLSEKEKELTQAKIENTELRRKLQDIQGRFGIIDESSIIEDFGPMEHGMGYDFASGRVLDWTITEVVRWWRQELPPKAQQFVPAIEECNLTGKDLLELDSEMLEQLGIRKLLVMKILKAIEPLKESIPVEYWDNISHTKSTNSKRSKSIDRHTNNSRRSRSRSRKASRKTSELAGSVRSGRSGRSRHDPPSNYNEHLPWQQGQDGMVATNTSPNHRSLSRGRGDIVESETHTWWSDGEGANRSERPLSPGKIPGITSV